MDGEAFDNFRKDMFELYLKKEFHLAYNLVVEKINQFPKQNYTILTWKACLLSILGREDEAHSTLEEGKEMGYWWSQKYLNSEPDFDNIRKNQRFLNLSQYGDEKMRQEKSKPYDISVQVPQGSSNTSYPVFLGLHYRGGNIEEFSPYFKSVLTHGYLLVIPQSSQIYNMKEYCWDDEIEAVKQIGEVFSKVKENYKIDLSNIVVCGASQGSTLALTMSLEMDLEIRGIIFFMPSPKIIEIGQKILENREKFERTKFFSIVGEQDPSFEAAKKFNQLLHEHNIKIKTLTIQELGHNLPVNIEKYLSQAIKFVNEG